jgi:hypothetical protein
LQRLAVTGLGEMVTVMLAWVGAAGFVVPPQDDVAKRMPTAATAHKPRENTAHRV